MRLRRIVTRQERSKVARFAKKRIDGDSASLALSKAANPTLVCNDCVDANDLFCERHLPHVSHLRRGHVYANCLQCGKGVCSACCPHALPSPELPLDW